MATVQQQRAFMEYLKNIENTDDAFDKPTKKKILKKAGYSDSVAEKPEEVFGSKGWEQMMQMIDNTPYLAKLHDIAMSEDKRSALKAIDMLLEIQGKGDGGDININVSNKREEIFGA